MIEIVQDTEYRFVRRKADDVERATLRCFEDASCFVVWEDGCTIHECFDEKSVAEIIAVWWSVWKKIESDGFLELAEAKQLGVIPTDWEWKPINLMSGTRNQDSQ